MNKKISKKSIEAVIIAGVVCIALVIGGVAAFAEEDLLSPGGTQVTAGSGLPFKVNLGEVKEEYAQGEQTFTLTVNISPSPESVSVSPDVNISQYGSKYTISSADLADISALTFTAYPGSKLKDPMTYTVSADIAGSLSTPSDSFTFLAIPKKEQKDDPTPKKKNRGSGGISSAVSTDSSTVYRGSADNYLKTLAVTGYDFTEKFNSTRDTYFIQVPDDVDSVGVKATAHDSSAAVRVAGNEDVSSERSKILISVTADNGDVRTYRIFVTHKAEDEQ